jgi:Tol biopolymer transport system component
LRVAVEVAPDALAVRMIRWAQYSPDGTKVLFQALGRLWVQDLSTGERRRLTAGEGPFEFYPSFSRDGRRVA